MPRVRPFAALRYDPRVAGPLEALVAPPYDVISDSQRAEYRARSPYNVVRLTLPDSPEDAARDLAAWQDVTPILEEYKAKERIRFLGITDYRTSMFPELMQAMRTGVFDTIQIPYNLGEREAEREVLPLARTLNLGVLVMTPLCPMFDRTRLLRALQRHDLGFLRPYGVTTPGQALLKYLLANPDVSTLLPATSRLERVKENTAAADGPVLPQDVLRQLEAMMR